MSALHVGKASLWYYLAQNWHSHSIEQRTKAGLASALGLRQTQRSASRGVSITFSYLHVELRSEA